MTMARLIFPPILSCIIAYLLCGIPFGLLVARAHGVDVRKVGSGNIGTTNVARAAGVGASGLTLLLDAGKGFVSMMIARLIIPAMGQVEVKAIAPDQPSGIVIAIVYGGLWYWHRRQQAKKVLHKIADDLKDGEGRS